MRRPSVWRLPNNPKHFLAGNKAANSVAGPIKPISGANKALDFFCKGSVSTYVRLGVANPLADFFFPAGCMAIAGFR
jgi:hypothetical protein